MFLCLFDPLEIALSEVCVRLSVSFVANIIQNNYHLVRSSLSANIIRDSGRLLFDVKLIHDSRRLSFGVKLFFRCESHAGRLSFGVKLSRRDSLSCESASARFIIEVS